MPVTSSPTSSVRPGGHEIALTVNVKRGRIQDFLRLTSRSGTPLLTGALATKTTFEIPPGPELIYERLKLMGHFALDGAKFTNAKMQDSITELSLREQGRPKDAESGQGTGVCSTMQSNFKMAGGVVALPDLKYTVPGAEIDLTGQYGIDGSTLDFSGTVKIQATVSQFVGGWKGVLLKPVDRFFKKDGAGTEVHIHIDGTRKNLKFGIDFRRLR